ncbi:MAG: hypothetical protein ACYC2Y_06180 [Armatimonadota bacterium]
MIAQRRYEVVRPVIRKRRKKASLIRLILRDQMARVIILAVVAVLVGSVYVSAYSRFTSKGYLRGELLSTLSDLRKENESLRLDLETMKQPECIEEFAMAGGMEQSKEMAYIESDRQPRLAENPERIR